jgi:glycosyltransferase involved in cell wall biosynthesis
LGRGVIESLEEGARLDGCLQECSRLPDATVTGMLKGARALWLPSLAEGYGLPLAAALTCGTPVPCSDIPVFREVGGGIPDYIDPTGAAAWRQAVLNYAQQHSLQHQVHLRRLGCWQRPTWEQHFAVVDTALSKL